MQLGVNVWIALLSLLCAIGIPWHEQPASTKRNLTVQDCVQVTRLFEGQVSMSPDGSQVAYVVKTPDLERNQNVYALYNRSLSEPGRTQNGTLLLKSDSPIGSLRWETERLRLVVSATLDSKEVILEIDPATRTSEVMLSFEQPGISFSIDGRGDTIVYCISPRGSDRARHDLYTQYGYPVLFGEGTAPPVESRGSGKLNSLLFVARRQADGHFAAAQMEIALAPLESVGALSLSPDGRFVTFSYMSGDMPQSWLRNSYFRWRQSIGGKPSILGLFDFQTGGVRVAFDSPSAGWGQPVVWAADSQTFTLNAMAPLGTAWEERDVREEVVRDEENWSYVHTHTFSVDVQSGAISEIVKAPALWYQNQVLAWKEIGGQLLLRKDDKTFAWMEPDGDEWKEIREISLPCGGVNLYASEVIGESEVNVTSDGRSIVGMLENAMTPPDLFFLDPQESGFRVLTDLNPQLREVQLSPIEKFKWSDKFGFHCSGLLIKPIHFLQGKQYPLVIMGKGWWENYFLTDTQFQTVFAPQSLASAGFLVLLANERPAEFVWDRTRRYPGVDNDRIGEAGEFLEFSGVIEGAVRKLCELGLADKENVGIIGFSTTSWKTDMVLTHTDLHFRAASSADSGLWNYGLYWLPNRAIVMASSEKYMGGPPYGKTLKNWLEYSPAFNASHVTTPLLMEYTDHGAYDPNIDGMEFFVALKKQNKPVDLFFYPKGNHLLDTPSQRVASLQRNVDWFRFWMQGYEGEVPDYDPDQYIRWRELRKLQQQNEAKARAAAVN